MKQLFLKSNILHIRTNEGEFEVSNPEMIGGFYNQDETFIFKELSHDDKLMFFGPGETIEWSGGVSFVHQIMGNMDAKKWETTHAYMYSKFPEDRRRILARLIPEKYKKVETIQMPKVDEILDNFTPSPEQQQRAQFVDWIVLDKLAPDQLFTKVWNTYVVPLESEIKALRDWKESALAVFAEWDRVSDYIKPRCRLGDKYSARALELFKMIDAENKALQEKLKIAEHLKELADDAIVTLQKEVEKLKADNESLLMFKLYLD